MTRLTDWFPADVKPVHEGTYATQLIGSRGCVIEEVFSHWNGRWWSNQFNYVERAHVDRHNEGVQDKPWRGLAEKPE